MSKVTHRLTRIIKASKSKAPLRGVTVIMLACASLDKCGLEDTFRSTLTTNQCNKNNPGTTNITRLRFGVGNNRNGAARMSHNQCNWSILLRKEVILMWLRYLL